MWVGKIVMNGEKALFGAMAKKFGLSLLSYTLTHNALKNSVNSFIAVLAFGSEKDISNFSKELKKTRRVVDVEYHNNFFLIHLKDPKEFRKFYSYATIQIDPTFIQKDGTYIWTIGSWNREEILKLFREADKSFGAKLVKIKEEKIDDISLFGISPQLTYKQKEAIGAAVSHGYYDYPRKIRLEELAAIMKVSYSTFQEHLRKAEQKLLPYYAKVGNVTDK